MATISGNGGAERYWRHEDGRRAVRCRNGMVLVQTKPWGRWQRLVVGLDGADPAGVPTPSGWAEDTGQAARAAVTRTGRVARRREGG